jgi:hypothetical protein
LRKIAKDETPPTDGNPSSTSGRDRGNARTKALYKAKGVDVEEDNVMMAPTEAEYVGVVVMALNLIPVLVSVVCAC